MIIKKFKWALLVATFAMLTMSSEMRSGMETMGRMDMPVMSRTAMMKTMERQMPMQEKNMDASMMEMNVAI